MWLARTEVLYADGGVWGTSGVRELTWKVMRWFQEDSAGPVSGEQCWIFEELARGVQSREAGWPSIPVILPRLGGFHPSGGLGH